MGVDVLNLVPNRFDFPYMVIPFCETSGTVERDEDENRINIMRKAGLFGSNINWQCNELYCGPTTVFSDSASYNKMLGIDPIELWVSPDTYDCFNHVSEKGFVGTGAMYGEIDPIPRVKYEGTLIPGMLTPILDFSQALTMGTGLIKKFGLRQSAFYQGVGIINSQKPHVCLVAIVPKVRDVDSIVVKLFEGDSLEQVRHNIGIYLLTLDVSREIYNDVYISDVNLDSSSISAVGCLVVASHLTRFQYKSTALIAGVTKHTHED